MFAYLYPFQIFFFKKKGSDSDTLGCLCCGHVMSLVVYQRRTFIRQLCWHALRKSSINLLSLYALSGRLPPPMHLNRTQWCIKILSLNDGWHDFYDRELLQIKLRQGNVKFETMIGHCLRGFQLHELTWVKYSV